MKRGSMVLLVVASVLLLSGRARAQGPAPHQIYLPVLYGGNHMAVAQGPRYAGTGTDDAAVGTNPWTAAGSIAAQDTSYATANSTYVGTVTSHYLKGTDFGFTIPASATVTGIVLEIRRTQQAGAAAGCSIYDSGVYLIKGGSVVGSNKASGTPWPTTGAFAYQSYGSSTDLWGTTWQASDINSSSFGAVLSVTETVDSGDVTPQVDAVRITVYYTTPTPSFRVYTIFP